MNGVMLRPLTDLERRLLEEITGELEQWIKKNFDVNDEPGEEVLVRVKNTAMRIEHLGYRMTNFGVMMIDTPDILEYPHDLDVMSEMNRVWNEAWSKMTASPAQ